jgi:7-cyano-7-deazaguanine synthase
MQTNAPSGRAVLLLSGGLDSTTMLALARSEGREVHALTFSYGQRHGVEVSLARRSAAKFGVASHRVIEIDLRAFGHSALTADDIPVPRGRSDSDMSRGIPVTYVPARNTIFLAYALAAAEVVGAGEIFIGVNSVDYSGYPDCRPEYIRAFESLAALATRSAVEDGVHVHIRAPLLHLSKREIIALGRGLGVNYADTLSCYDPDEHGAACGVCDACQIRRRGFAESGVEDPAEYATPARG